MTEMHLVGMYFLGHSISLFLQTMNYFNLKYISKFILKNILRHYILLIFLPSESVLYLFLLFNFFSLFD